MNKKTEAISAALPNYILEGRSQNQKAENWVTLTYVPTVPHIVYTMHLYAFCTQW